MAEDKGPFLKVMDAAFWLPYQMLQGLKIVLGLVALFLIFMGLVITYVFFGNQINNNEAAEYAAEGHPILVDYRHYGLPEGNPTPVLVVWEGLDAQDYPLPYSTFGAKDLANSKGILSFDDWLSGKVAKMYRAYIVATWNIEDLRRVIALHEPGSARWAKVYLPDAPVMRINYYVNGGETINGVRYFLGMCLLDHCKKEDMAPVSHHWEDLFQSSTYLTPGQKLAYEALLNTGTKEFWLKEAHLNGVYDDNVIIKEQVRTQQNLEQFFNSKTHE